ncbi:hypothetical protein BKA04_000826 [Cryobacterium mesophilum]|nr:HNH endonuclease signature motif containing protein [Terrimesophilobacter mesophilus]MBB5632603.1 hypothetical protein [Terrimesophilobacter mesophilus]
MSTFEQSLVESAAAVATFGASSADYDALTDERVIELGVAIAALERAFGLVKTQHAAQIARRSRREFGHTGLAARNGFASPQKLLQEVTKVTAREAGQLVALGNAMGEAEAARELIDTGVTELGGVPVEPAWDEPICQAITTGTLTVDCADALRRGLGQPTVTVTGGMLSDVAERLIREKSNLSADRILKAARLERDLIDLDGIQARQQELYERGGVRLSSQPDGMWRLTGQLDPESAAILTTALDPYTSPRRGGPRFTRPDDAARAQAIIDDPRTTERLTLDGLLELVTLGASVDPQKMQPKRRTLVKIVTTVDTVVEVPRNGAEADAGAQKGRGFGVLEDNGEVVSAATVQLSVCDGDTLELTIDRNGRPLDLGRTSRLYDRRQREALAARDGGCLWPDCDRPPAFTEAHHTRQWKRDRGRTDVDDGVLLCRFHHLQLHNNHWEIERRDAEFWLIPPPTVDAARVPVKLCSKNPLLEHLRRAATG